MAPEAADDVLSDAAVLASELPQEVSATNNKETIPIKTKALLKKGVSLIEIFFKCNSKQNASEAIEQLALSY
jgi:hypothetical protein